MGGKLWFTGTTLVLAPALLNQIPAGNIVGEILMILGVILMWLDK